MNTAELLKKVRRVEIITSRLVDEVLAGNYGSAFRGAGMEFDEVREYQPGDDIRSIDWNVTARSGRPHVKRFSEERELTVMIMVDASRSVAFGSGGQSKMELASEIGAVLAFSATANHDKAGLIIFTDRVHLYLPPKKGRGHVLRMIREMLDFSTPPGARTDIAKALDFLGRVQRRRSVAFLISDFYDSGFERPLSLAGKRHDLIPIQISDRGEEAFPSLGLMRVEDAETGEQMLIDSSSASERLGLLEKSRAFASGLGVTFKRRDIDAVSVRTGSDYIMPLRMLFRRREKRR